MGLLLVLRGPPKKGPCVLGGQAIAIVCEPFYI
jgi:hypothetical protein